MKAHDIFTTIVLWLLLVSAAADLIFSLAVYMTKPIFNEANPIYIVTGNIWLFAIIKIVVVWLFYLYFTKWYFKTPQFFRFGMVVLLLVAILGQISGAKSGLNELQKPPEVIQPIPDDVKLQDYKDTNASKGFFLFFGFVLFNFWLWQQFDRRVIR